MKLNLVKISIKNIAYTALRFEKNDLKCREKYKIWLKVSKKCKNYRENRF